MKKLLTVICVIISTLNIAMAQEKNQNPSKWLIGFNGVLQGGGVSATALTNQGEQITKGYGMGLIIQRKITPGFNIFIDGNVYNYNVFLAGKGEDVQSIWTVSEMAEHWDETNAPHIQYVNDLPTDVHFDMQTTGFRLGGKYIFGKNKFKPWLGAGFGFYKWQVNYYNEDKDQTYGSDTGFTTGLTYMLGLDFEIMEGTELSIFGDLTSPVIEYSIDKLFYPQWDIEDYQALIMGPYRLGITLSFAPGGKK